MARTSGAESKKRLLAAAEALFAEKGYKGTKVSDIVARAGLTQAAFYLYFRSKEEVFEQLLNDFDERLMQISDAGKRATDLLPQELPSYIGNTFATLFNLFSENYNLSKIALHHALDREQMREKIVGQIACNMSQNQTLGLVKSDLDVAVIAESVVAASERLAERYVLAKEAGEWSDEESELSKGGDEYARAGDASLGAMNLLASEENRPTSGSDSLSKENNVFSKEIGAVELGKQMAEMFLYGIVAEEKR